MRDWSLNIELSCNISETGSKNRDEKKFIPLSLMTNSFMLIKKLNSL